MFGGRVASAELKLAALDMALYACVYIPSFPTNAFNTDKIFRHIWRLQLKYALYRITLIGKSKATRKQLKERWTEKLSPLGSG